MNSKITSSLLISMVLIYIVANLLPAVNVDLKINIWNKPDVPSSIHTIVGYGCTLYDPSGWLAFLVHFLAIFLFIVSRYKKKYPHRYWRLLPIASFIYGVSISIYILSRDQRNELLIGNNLWILSLLIAVIFYWKLTDKKSPNETHSKCRTSRSS